MPEAADGQQESARALERASRIMEAVTASTVPMTIADIERATGLPKATAYRLTRQLVHLKLLESEPGSKRHTEGPRLRALSWNAINAAGPRSVRLSLLASLVGTIGETCYIVMLTNGELNVVDSRTSGHTLCINVTSGMRMPLHATAAGKLLLAEHLTSQRANPLDGHTLTAFTPHTLIAPAHLEIAAAEIARKGHATENQEHAIGVVGVAVAIRSAAGRPIGALSMVAPMTRLSLAAAERHAPELHLSARRLAETFTAG